MESRELSALCSMKQCFLFLIQKLGLNCHKYSNSCVYYLLYRLSGVLTERPDSRYDLIQNMSRNGCSFVYGKLLLLEIVETMDITLTTTVTEPLVRQYRVQNRHGPRGESPQTHRDLTDWTHRPTLVGHKQVW